MILTDVELQAYRALVGLQVQYAQRGDSHKVMELQMLLEDTIKKTAEAKIKSAGAGAVVLAWTDQALAEYRRRCADAMIFADKGFHAWAAAQGQVEQWLSNYIEQAVFQATINFKLN